MNFELGSFKTETLHAFQYQHGQENFIVTTFEDHLPDKFDYVSSKHDPMPPKSHVPLPARNKEGYEYHTYLPKDRQAVLNYHLFGCLSETCVVTRDGLYELGNGTKKAWSSLENNLSWSIHCLLQGGTLTTLEDRSPPLADTYGYLRPHKSHKGLNFSILLSKHTFILRVTIFTFTLIFLLSSKRPNIRSNHDMALSYLIFSYLIFSHFKVTPSR